MSSVIAYQKAAEISPSRAERANRAELQRHIAMNKQSKKALSPLEEAMRDDPELREIMRVAYNRSAEAMQRILQDPSMLRLKPFAEKLKFPRLNLNSSCRCRVVNAMRRKQEVLALHQKKYARYFYPEWQIDPQTKQVYPAIAELFKILGHPLAVYRFLVNRNSAFEGKTGLEIMRGEDEKLLCNGAEALARGDFN